MTDCTYQADAAHIRLNCPDIDAQIASIAQAQSAANASRPFMPVESIWDHADAYVHTGLTILACLVGAIIVFTTLRRFIVYIPNTHYGVVERVFAMRGREPEAFAPMSLGRAAGYLPNTLRGGWHFFIPFVYRVHKRPLIVVDQIAYLVARVGAPLHAGQALGSWPADVDPSDAQAFLTNGGQSGPQRRILRSGTYAINTALFGVVTPEATYTLGFDLDDEFHDIIKNRDGYEPIIIGMDSVGIVTVQDGPSLSHGEIIAPAVGTNPASPSTFHNSFQDPEKFLLAGGCRGRQEQVLVEGTYYINRLFATVELGKKTHIDIGTVGVVTSYVGVENPESLTAENGRGRTVEKGQRGIWRQPLEPGKYAINEFAMGVTKVPTTNFQLRWTTDGETVIMADGQSYDDDLKEIPVITSDAFEILIPLSIVAHIAPINAPYVVQRFSQVQRLVNQTLDPFISSYFKDTAQSKTLLDFVKERAEIGQTALAAMKERLSEHKIEIEEVMVGTPKSPPNNNTMEVVLDQLRQRQVALQQQQTYEVAKVSAQKQREMNEELARAEQQPRVTAAALQIDIAESEGRASTARDNAAADGIRIRAEAEAHATKVKAEAYGGPENLIRMKGVEAIALATEKGAALVPTTLVSGAVDGGGLLGLLTAVAAQRIAP